MLGTQVLTLKKSGFRYFVRALSLQRETFTVNLLHYTGLTLYSVLSPHTLLHYQMRAEAVTPTSNFLSASARPWCALNKNQFTMGFRNSKTKIQHI